MSESTVHDEFDAIAASEASVPMEWSDAFLLGYEPMDETHREFVECVHRLQTASATDLVDALNGVLRHAQLHFDQERQWMEGTQFPATQCHVDEHDAVLKSLHEVSVMLQAGCHRRVVRDLARALADWFPGHADYMDAALSHWMSKRSHGGAPIVLRRRIVPPPAPPVAESQGLQSIAARVVPSPEVISGSDAA